MLNDSVIDELQSKALSVLECTLDKHYTYHNAAHTREVCDAVKLFTANSILPSATLTALRIAAIFHDFGYLVRSYDNELLALPYIKDFGREFGIEESVLMEAHDLISETVFPYAPVTPAGMILCDADIEYIGRKDFFVQAELFRQELSAEGVVYTDEQWWSLEVKFLQENCFFTPVCRNLRNSIRMQNLKKAQAYLLKARQECL